MPLEIKPGTLCYIKGEAGYCAPNNGKVVEVLQLYQNPLWKAKAWLCVSKSKLRGYTWPEKKEAVIASGEEHIMPEFNLLPIAGPGLEDEVKRFDSLPVHSTRSLEHVRR